MTVEVIIKIDKIRKYIGSFCEAMKKIQKKNVTKKK